MSRKAPIEIHLVIRKISIPLAALGAPPGVPIDQMIESEEVCLKCGKNGELHFFNDDIAESLRCFSNLFNSIADQESLIMTIKRDSGLASFLVDIEAFCLRHQDKEPGIDELDHDVTITSGLGINGLRSLTIPANSQLLFKVARDAASFFKAISTHKGLLISSAVILGLSVIATACCATLAPAFVASCVAVPIIMALVLAAALSGSIVGGVLLKKSTNNYQAFLKSGRGLTVNPQPGGGPTYRACVTVTSD